MVSEKGSYQQKHNLSQNES